MQQSACYRTVKNNYIVCTYRGRGDPHTTLQRGLIINRCNPSLFLAYQQNIHPHGWASHTCTQRRQSSMHGRVPEPPLDTMRSRSSGAFSSTRQ